MTKTSTNKPTRNKRATRTSSKSTRVSKTSEKPASKSPRKTPSLIPLNINTSSPVAKMVEIIEPQKSSQDIILSSENTGLLSGLAEEYKRGETLRRHGLSVRSRLLFCGPPGCGKSITAEAFANELNLNLLIVRLDSVVSSFLGETASNLRSVFEAAEKRPCVLFFDEFDAIAMARKNGTEHGELRRVVNSLLMFIERFEGKGFLIAATNLEASLDSALWRRFDEVVLFERPTAAKIKSMLKLKTKNFPAEFNIESRAKELAGFSYSEIERVCIQAIKIAILNSRKTLSQPDFDKSLKDEKRRRKIQKNLAPNNR